MESATESPTPTFPGDATPALLEAEQAAVELEAAVGRAQRAGHDLLEAVETETFARRCERSPELRAFRARLQRLGVKLAEARLANRDGDERER